MSTKTIANYLKQSASQLKNSHHARLEAELLLSHVVKKNRSHLIAYPEQKLTADQIHQFETLIKRRVMGEPIAYLLGQKEFWSLPLRVTSDTLIPRPETELLVEKILEKLPQNEVQRVVDLGTGSGAIALAIASERPHWEIYATDISEKALSVAQENAKHLKINNIIFSQGVWCEALPKIKFDAIVSNPPYIDPHDSHLTQGDVRFEPQQALVSEEEGLKDLRMIISQAQAYLVKGGWLFLEHGYQQGDAVRKMMQQQGYQQVETYLDMAGLERLSGGRC